MDHREFSYTSLEEVMEDARLLGLNLRFSRELSQLRKKVKINGRELPNSLAFHPMEGSDGNPDGSPGELTVRRYERMAKGGAGLIWFEAVAVVPEGKASPRQLAINKNNLDSFKRIRETISKTANKEYGGGFEPLCLMQLTHSGRFSRPEGKPAPIIACHNPVLDPVSKISGDYPVITDEQLERLEEKFLDAARLAREAGFDGVDVKGCHQYLNSELFGSFTREGRYGGTFEGRTRFIMNIVSKVREELGDRFITASRLNIYDGIPYPNGWGVDKEDYLKYDMDEPKKLVKQLYDKGVRIVNLTMGTPYYNPHVNRPYDKGGYIPKEHPLEGVARLLGGAAEIQREVPGMAVVGTGYSWLREFSQYLAAGTLESGGATVIGYGREGFAYPDFARDIMQGGMKREKCCITCGKCAEILRAGGTTGCVIKDSAVYGPIYKECCRKN